jgi:hypothetical protein
MTQEMSMTARSARVATSALAVLAVATACGGHGYHAAPDPASPPSSAPPAATVQSGIPSDTMPARSGLRAVGTDATTRASFALAKAMAGLDTTAWHATLAQMRSAVVDARAAHSREARALRGSRPQCGSVAGLLKVVGADFSTVDGGYHSLVPVFTAVSTQLDVLSASTNALRARLPLVADGPTHSAVVTALAQAGTTYQAVTAESVTVSGHAAKLWSAAEAVQWHAQRQAARHC